MCKILFSQILRSDNNLKNSDAEIQQRALEYLKLSTVASPDVLVRLTFWAFVKIIVECFYLICYIFIENVGGNRTFSAGPVLAELKVVN